MAQLTFDLEHPKIQGSSDYIGIKKGNKTVIKEPIQVISSSKQVNSQTHDKIKHTKSA